MYNPGGEKHNKTLILLLFIDPLEFVFHYFNLDFSWRNVFPWLFAVLGCIWLLKKTKNRVSEQIFENLRTRRHEHFERKVFFVVVVVAVVVC